MGSPPDPQIIQVFRVPGLHMTLFRPPFELQPWRGSTGQDMIERQEVSVLRNGIQIIFIISERANIYERYQDTSHGMHW